MKIDVGSFSYNIRMKNGGGTPVWGTALGQGDKYLIKEDYSDLAIAMLYNAIQDTKQIEIPLGKGGKQRDNYLFSIAALFRNVKVNGNIINGAQYVLLVLKQLKGIHVNRSFVKYSPRITYNGININEDCIQKINETLNWKNSAWFVSDIDFCEQDTINFIAHKLGDGPVEYGTASEKKNAMYSAIGDGRGDDEDQDQDQQYPPNDIDSNLINAGSDEAEYEDVFHYTSLESAIAILTHYRENNFTLRATRCDCLNDPNEIGEIGDGVFDNRDRLPFILSFSTNDDSQLMWRLYNSQIQLCFSRKDIENEVSDKNTELTISCKKVNYKEPQEKDFYKDKDWSIEEEWRLVAYDKDEKNDFKEKDIQNTMTKYGLVQLFRSINIPVNSLKGIKILAVNDTQFKILKRQLTDILNPVMKDVIENKDDFISKAQCAPFRRQ